jgi:hypothetical protein
LTQKYSIPKRKRYSVFCWKTLVRAPRPSEFSIP